MGDEATENMEVELDLANNTDQPADTNTAVDLEAGITNQEFTYPSLFTSRTLLELSNSSWSRTKRANREVQPYLRGCKWSPDGTCCLSVVNNDGVHVTELARDLYSGDVDSSRVIDVMDSVIHVKEAGLVYDFCWFPGMNSAVPETCCWLTTRQNAPVQMWDAFDGSLRCSYRGFNAADEMEPAFSVTFMPDCSRIIAGYKKYIRTFDVVRPGREYAEHKISSPASCLATCDNLLAVGSWNTSISLYNISEMGTYKSIGKMYGHGGNYIQVILSIEGGVTHMKFGPDGLRLVTGARKDHRLLIWDIRYYRTPLNILSRVVDTNQRIYFDISPCGKYLVTGGTDGVMKVWDADQVNWKSNLNITDENTDCATYKFPLHKDCCNSVSIHPCRPLVATGSGQYHMIDPISALEDNIDTLSADTSNNNTEVDGVQKSVECTEATNNDKSDKVDDIDMKYSSISENSLVFWWIGDVPNVQS